MTTYRVTADLSGNTDDKFKADIEADNEDQAWTIAYKSQLPRGIYNGKVEELPTRAELLASIQELKTATINYMMLVKHGSLKKLIEAEKSLADLLGETK